MAGLQNAAVPAAAAAEAREGEPEGAHEQQPQRPPTSRICVKNLPKYIDDRRLREHFAAKGEVTDAKVMRTRDGKSRCFGFVGFRSPGEAEAAVKYFNRSFLDTMRLAVEFAYKMGAAEAPRAWSKYTAGTSANKKVAAPETTGGNAVPLGAGEDGQAGSMKKKKGKKEPAPEEADPKLREFLSVMQPRAKQAIWANDDLAPAGAAAAAATAAGGKTQRRTARGGAAEEAGQGGEAGGAGSSSDDEYEELPLGAAGGATPTSSSGGEEEGEEEEDEEGGEGRAADAVVRNAAVSDLDYLRSRVKASFDDDDEAWAAGAGGTGSDASGSGSEGEEGSEGEAGGSSGSEEEEEEGGAAARRRQQAAAQAPAAAQQQQQQHGSEAGGKPQRRRRGAGGSADEELDAIFGGGGGAASGRDEEDGEDGGGSDAEMADASEDEGEGEGAGAAAADARGGGGQGPAVAAVDAADEASIADTGRLFVRNLPYTATEADLSELFQQYGELAGVHLVLDRATKKSKGFAHVQFADAQDALRAHAELDASIFQGRLIHILPGKRPPAPPDAAAAAADGAGEGEGGEGGEGGGGAAKEGGKAGTSSYKQQKEAALKASAGNRSAWNSLFMRADTVAEAVAAHFGVSKAELLDREAGDMAVRLALGETHVVAETKRALGEAGADVSKLEAAAAAGGKAAASKGVARSDSVLLVKNLPYSASEAELEALFGAMGPLGRLVLPTTRTLALVEFLEPQDARRAFKALAYKRYQHVPLYLEWAPRGIFSAPPPPRPAAAAAAAAAKGSTTAAAAAAPTAAAAGGKAGGKAAKPAAAEAELLTGLAEAQADEAESSTIYVKNLAWATAEAALRAHFDAAVSAAGGSLRAVTVARRKGPDGKQLSAGFGFVECSSEAAAKAAVKALQGSELDGHKLVLQLSLRKASGTEAGTDGKRKAGAAAAGAAAGAGKGGKAGAAGGKLPGTTKMVVRNVAFEATRKDITGLFTPFGQVKSCRLPRKFDGSHRGFAFVDFATKQEARNAMEAVQGAHLYGRRLVLEWAEEEGGLDELRAKTAAKFRGEEEDGAAPAAPAAEQPRQKKRQRTKK